MAERRQARGSRYTIDPAHEAINIYDEHDPTNTLTLDIWRSKYRFGDEYHPFDSHRRVVEGVYAKDSNTEAKVAALEAMQKGLWIPAGRIQAGAGTPNIVTLLNCYMCQDINDSMVGIHAAIGDAMLTMQQGGGIGMNFSTLRPSGAYLRRTGAVASGPLPFMDMWDSMCRTIMSAGSRRGAMMAVMDCEHPDLIEFIEAKQEAGRLTNFNVSVLITDAFMGAVAADEEWFLGCSNPRADGKHLFTTVREDGDVPEEWYAYSKWSARDLWDRIIRNTYEWAEPGVVFIDRVNRTNNLRYCETITGTNPCGEQPLPPNGCCNLGAVNLARMVINPFTPQARFDHELLAQIATLGTRFLDNVIDVTHYPLEAQTLEEVAKRRIGIGITGLANALAQLELRYGGPEALAATDIIMRTLRDAVYDASMDLASERGPFPLYDRDEFGAHSPVVRDLGPNALAKLYSVGIRNGVLLTIAPTGTTSLKAGNVSSGLEPVYLRKAKRNVLQSDGSTKPYDAYDYGFRLYIALHGDIGSFKFPDYMVTHEDLTPTEHLEMQAVCQKYVDASISKTINCPKDMTFEAFEDIYTWAYAHGLKGCTTYRPSDVRGSVLSAEEEPSAVLPSVRPEVLKGSTYKIKWPSVAENYYITINDAAGLPFEVFIQSTSSKYTDWTTALGLMISAIMRKGGDISFIPEELSKVRSAEDSGWVDGKNYGSLVALIGHTIGKHLFDGVDSVVEESTVELIANPMELCTACNQMAVVNFEGCATCTNCGDSRCG